MRGGGVAMDKSIGKELDEVGFLVRAQHQIDTINLTDTLRLQLRIATRNNNESSRMLANHTVNGLPALMISNLSDGAGIDETDVCTLTFLSSRHPHLTQHLAKCRGL